MAGEPDWDDTTRILAALMRLNEGVEKLNAKLSELLGEENDDEEEPDA